jgi:hypothetical protein
LNLGGDGVAGFELEEHGHAVTAQTEKHALAQAQHATVTPEHDQAQRDKGITEVLADQVQAKQVQAQRKNHQQHHCQQQHAGQAVVFYP